jgi:hypothetical protein
MTPFEGRFPFGYLFPKLHRDPANLVDAKLNETVAMLKRLGVAMGDDPNPDGNSRLPAAYTYFGQFVDHDLTANTDRNEKTNDITSPDIMPLPPDYVRTNLENLRKPFLELDSVYGEGRNFGGPPTRSEVFYDGPKFKLGKNADVPGIPGVKIPPEADLDRDLPRRNDRVPLIGDTRNDENTIISQLHVAFLRFHNALVDHLAKGGMRGEKELFEEARRLARLHYQHIVLHDFLPRIADPDVVRDVTDKGPSFYRPDPGRPFMPLEFSVAAYRFGHSMVRNLYDYNRNFPGNDRDSGATFVQLFQFTGRGGFFGLPTLPFNWIIEWDRLIAEKDGRPVQSARKIDTRLAEDLFKMVNETTGDANIDPDAIFLMQHLAIRNLLRGFLLSIPTGQALAKAMSVKPLDEAELLQNAGPGVEQALREGGFLQRTPAWFYVLKEAEVRAGGEHLGPVASRIVAEVFVGLLRADPDSILNTNFSPDNDGVGVKTLSDLLRFAGVMA